MVETEDLQIVEMKPVSVSLDKLKLDLSNVRFQHMFEKIDEEKMEKLIWDEQSTKQLCDQIRTSKGLYEEPVIDSDYTVLEGNRRVVCLRRLKIKANAGELPGIEKNMFDTVKCKMIPKDTPEINKKLYLATIHVKGKLSWPAFNKAKQINDLHTNFNLSFDRLAKLLGMGKVTIMRMAKAYEQTDKYGHNYPDDREWYHKYGYFDELFRKRDLKDFSDLQKNVDSFASWVHEDKFNEASDVRALAQILSDEDARRKFDLYGFTEAFKLIQEKNPALKSKEFRQISKTIKIIRFFSRKELIKAVKDSNRLRMLQKLKEEVDNLLQDISTLEKEND